MYSMDKTLPTTKLSRGKIVGKAMLKIGVKKSRQLITRSSKNDHDTEVADIIFEALGELKGVSVKIAQQVALGMPFLPPEYLDKIEKSFSQIPTINKALVRKIIKTEFGVYPHELFDSFEMQAFGSASLGQVHKALKDGNSLAVKVQYPGIKKSIQTDMSLIHFGLKRFAKGKNVDHIIEEISDRLYEEIDYELEAKNCDYFRKNNKNSQIVIPKVYHENSTQKVLSSTFIKGLDFQTFLTSSPSQEQINSYAQLIFDNFYDSLYTLKAIHADPNPGNFIFLEDGKLALIDFGCVKKIDEEFLSSYTALHLDLIAGVDDEVLSKHYQKLGMIEEDTQEKMLHFYQEVIKPLDRLYIEPLRDTTYDFSIHKDFSKRGFEAIFEVQKKQFHSVHQVNEEFIFLDRTLLGYYALFEKMGAKIDTTYVKNLIKEYQNAKNA